MRLLLKSAMGHLSPEQLARLTKGVDVVGDVAILRLPDEFQDERFRIAERLLDLAPHIRVVLEQTGPVESQFRTRKLEWLAGEHRTETVHREFGCQYRVDVGTSYFSPRLSHERERIADLVSRGECVVNFFAGVGSFSIMIAKHSRPSKIYSIDLNPSAARYHAINNRLNGVQDTIDLICGDASQIVLASLIGCANRVLMPLPEVAVECLPTAKRALKNDHGVVHCYVFVDSSHRSEASKQALLKFKPILDRLGAIQSDVEGHVVRSVGPCRYQVCLDLRL